MAKTQEATRQATYFKVEVWGKNVENVRFVSGGDYDFSTPDATTSGAGENMSTVGRTKHQPLTLNFALAEANKYLLVNTSKYLQNSQDGSVARTPISVQEVTHDAKPGMLWNYHECMPIRMRLPVGVAQSTGKPVDVEIEFAFNYMEHTEGGVK